MNKTRIAALVAITALFATTALHGQTGCTDSPENPTAILGLVGAGGWMLASSRCCWIGKLLQRILDRLM
jgi:XrtJ-associated TM-motif-TM protein